MKVKLKNILLILKQMIIIPIYLSSTCLFFSASAEEKCMHRRYIFDIGSSTTKSAAYTVNSCTKTILSKTQKHLQQNYRYCLIHDKDKNIVPEDCIERGINVLKELQKHYGIDCHKNTCVGFATAWARDASNTDEWLQKVGALGIKMHFLSQEKEGILAFKAIESKATQYNTNSNSMLVLDIGGGSTQISGFIKEKYFSYNGPYGTDTFIKHLLSKFRPNDKPMSMNEHIENPLMFSSEEVAEVIKYSQDFWKNSLDNDISIKQKIKNNENIHLVGIGVLMRVGLRKQLNLDKEIISKDDILNLIHSMCDLNKEQINEKYPLLQGVAFSSQSAMLILYSIMSGLNIESIRISDDDVMSYIALNPRVLD